MGESSAVDDAVALLRHALNTARETVADLTAEIARVEAALTSLGHDPSQSVDASRSDVRAARTGSGAPSTAPDTASGDGPTSVMGKVRDYLNSHAAPVSPAELYEALRATDSRTDERLKSSIRTALYHLRKRGEAKQADGGKTIAVRHASTDAKGSAVTDPLVLDLRPRGGDDSDEQGNDDHDHDLAGRDRDNRSSGASVVSA